MKGIYCNKHAIYQFINHAGINLFDIILISIFKRLGVHTLF
jgi:hypothetical protein